MQRFTDPHLTPEEVNQHRAWLRHPVATQTAAPQPIRSLSTLPFLRVTTKQNNNTVFYEIFPAFKSHNSSSYTLMPDHTEPTGSRALIKAAVKHTKSALQLSFHAAFLFPLVELKRSCWPAFCSAINPILWLNATRQTGL